MGGEDMAKTTLTVCDMPSCGNKGAESYEVRFPDGVLKVDLCDDHAEALSGLREQVARSLFVKHGQRKKAIRVQVDPNAI